MKVHPLISDVRHPKLTTYEKARYGWYFYKGDRWYKMTEKQLVTQHKFLEPAGDTVLLEAPRVHDKVILNGNITVISSYTLEGVYVNLTFFTFPQFIELIRTRRLMYRGPCEW